MRIDCVTTPEITSLAGAGKFVRTHETEAMSEVCIAVSPDLSGVGVPIPTICHPAEDGLLPVEVSNGPGIAVFIVVAAPAVAVLEDSDADARLRK